jgi:hypothetical protein
VFGTYQKLYKETTFKNYLDAHDVKPNNFITPTSVHELVKSRYEFNSLWKQQVQILDNKSGLNTNYNLSSIQEPFITLAVNTVPRV